MVANSQQSFDGENQSDLPISPMIMETNTGTMASKF